MNLNEISSGRKSDTLAKKILDKLVRELKTPSVAGRIGSKMPAQIIISAEDMGFSLGDIEYVQLDFTFDPRLGMQEVATNAAYVRDGQLNRIEVEITYPNRPFRLIDISDIYPELLENLRHELEHSMQIPEDGELSSPENLETLADYITYYSDHTEVSAFVVGLMAKAKSARKSLSQIINDKMNAVIVDAEVSGLDEEEIKKLDTTLRNTYISYAKMRYPRMK